MSNRELRAFHRRQARAQARRDNATAASIKCPDCASRIILAEITDGIYGGVLEHTVDCPRRLEREP